jgi:hypothetical protein
MEDGASSTLGASICPSIACLFIVQLTVDDLNALSVPTSISSYFVAKQLKVTPHAGVCQSGLVSSPSLAYKWSGSVAGCSS